jgi:hypothetical protein
VYYFSRRFSSLMILLSPNPVASSKLPAEPSNVC